LFFTSCGTESANMILCGAVNHLGVTDIITSKTEHHCVLHTAELLAQNKNIHLHYVALDEKGNVRLDSLEKLLKTIPGKKLVALMHGNNEIGNISDIESI